MIDINELREAIQTFGSQAINEGDLNELLDRLEAAEKEAIYKKAFEISENTARDLTEKVIPNIRDQLETAEKERDRLKEIDSRRCAALNAQIIYNARQAEENDELRARIEERERQEPVGTLHDDGCFVWCAPRPYESNYAGWKMKLYLAPGAQAQPAPSEGSITAGILSGMFLSLDGHDKTQPGYEWRKGWNDAIRQAMDYAQPAPSIPEGWLRAIDEALVVAHIGVANESDAYEEAKAKLNSLIGFHVDVASDPAVNGGWKLVPIEPMPSMPKLHVGYLPTLNQDGYPALGTWWVQLWDGDDVFARVYGSSPEEAHNRAEMLAAAPEAKP